MVTFVDVVVTVMVVYLSFLPPVRYDGLCSRRRSSEQKLIFRMILPPSDEEKNRGKDLEWLDKKP